MSDHSTQAFRWLLSGRVQGVGFRHFTLTRAQQIGVGGWVRNLSDGRVEVQVAGAPEDVTELKRRLLEGPPWGRVEHLEEQVIDPDPSWTRFEVRF